MDDIDVPKSSHKTRLSDLSGAEIKDNVSGQSSTSRKAGVNNGLVQATHPSVITLGGPAGGRTAGAAASMATAKGAGGINYSRMNSSHQASIGDSLAIVNTVPGAPGSGVSLQHDVHASRDQS
jgi:hypothetical protein